MPKPHHNFLPVVLSCQPKKLVLALGLCGLSPVCLILPSLAYAQPDTQVEVSTKTVARDATDDAADNTKGTIKHPSNQAKASKSSVTNTEPKQKQGDQFSLEDYLPKYQARETEQETEQASEAESNNDKGFFKRLYNKWFGDDVGTLEKINVGVSLDTSSKQASPSFNEYKTEATDEATDSKKQPDIGSLDAHNRLEDNVKKALEQVTVDEFGDFRIILPRLRGIARDAAKAVGFYESQFVFERKNPNTLLVTIIPNAPVIITASNIAIRGDAKNQKRFHNILDSHVLAKGEVLNHGAYTEVKQALDLAAQNQGYFDSEFAASDVKVLLPENEATVNLVLNSGVRYHFGEVRFINQRGNDYFEDDLKGQTTVDKKIVQSLVPFEQGESFSQEKLTQLGQNLMATQYFSTIDVNIIKPPKPDDEQQGKLEFSESPDEKASEALPSDDNQLKKATDALKRVATSTPQVPIAASKADKKRQDEARKVRRVEAEVAKSVPIEVTLDSSRPNSAELGVGYGTDTKFRVRGQLSRNLVNRHGHSASLNTELSRIRQAVELRYKKPYKHPLDDTLTAFIGYEREKLNRSEESFDVLTEELAVGAQRDVKVGKWNHTGSLIYHLYRLDDEGNLAKAEDIPTRFRQSIGNKEQQALLLGYRLDNNHLKGGLYPYMGYRQYYQVEVGAKSVLTDVDMAILRAGFSGLYSFGETRRHQVVGRVDAGKFITKNFNAVPYKLRFFAGGDRSIRGYDYKSLSPLEDGYLLGGESLLTASAEYNYAVVPKWRAAVFADAGNAYNQDFTTETKVGAGLGVRWASPVGPVRLDIAAGILEDNPPVRFHFFIGPVF